MSQDVRHIAEEHGITLTQAKRITAKMLRIERRIREKRQRSV